MQFSLGSFVDVVLCDVIPMDDCHIYLGKPWKYLNKAVYDYDRDVYHINSGRKTLRPLSTDQVVHDMGAVKRMVQKWLKSQREDYRAERANEVKVVRVEPKQAVIDNVSFEKNEKTIEGNPENLHKKNDAQVVDVEDVKDDITHEEVVEQKVISADVLQAKEEKIVVTTISSDSQVQEESCHRENLFQARCMVQGKVCKLVVDGGRCANVVSQDFVKQMQLQVIPHPKPYSLRCLNSPNVVHILNSHRSLFL